jgi:hypothetical protein
MALVEVSQHYEEAFSSPSCTYVICFRDHMLPTFSGSMSIAKGLNAVIKMSPEEGRTDFSEFFQVHRSVKSTAQLPFITKNRYQNAINTFTSKS